MAKSTVAKHAEKPIRALVVDDSLFMRTLISDILNSDLQIKVVGTARSGKDALQKVIELDPDVVTLDYEMPKMDGLTALEYIMSEHPTPVVMVSGFTRDGADLTLDCLDHGAVDFILKPSGPLSLDIDKVKDELLAKVKAASRVSIKKIKSLLVEKVPIELPKPRAVLLETVVAIGASTGGPPVLEKILSELPEDFPVGILIVQHMPPKFTKSLAERLDKLCKISVREAWDGDVVESGVAYIAPGGYHMEVDKKKLGKYVKAVISVNKNPPVHNLRPSVDVLMKSVAEAYGGNVIGIILTGMGGDGTEGMKAIKEHGGRTLVQDEASCIVYGMAGRVVENGDADKIVPLDLISNEILRLL